ncbi:hypothetical protein [Streptomyces sp. NBC_01497]|uniref:hypothetical protein n=1 Tax=Streptomyces sp. NBC_01497 TaxID=2903885 RepID=UPI002E2F4F16|nr:hypothetical protein [Streptomyces sp. NBC_01497]
MTPRYTGRHTGESERPAVRRKEVSPGARRWGKVALWVGLGVCAAFVVFVVASFLGVLHDFDHPGDDGWLCSSDSSTCRP